MQRLTAAALLAAFFMVVVTFGTHAESEDCGDAAASIAFLENNVGEVLSASGYVGSNGRIEVYESAEHAFTILLIRPDGTACLIAAGDHWVKFDFLAPVFLPSTPDSQAI